MIDQFSITTVPIQMMFEGTELSIGTGFVWKEGEEFFLITNWHNVTGRDQVTKLHLSRTAAEPGRLIVGWNTKNALGHRIPGEVLLRSDDGKPHWLVHPRYGSGIDVAAIPLPPMSFADLHPINEMPQDSIVLTVGVDVFVVGCPFGLGPAGLPIWKRGSIASEPEVLDPNRPVILVDTASRPGMSGSPVLRRATGGYNKDGGLWVMSSGVATRLVGIYSGRLSTADAGDAQIEIVWPTELIRETVLGRRYDVT